MFLMDLAGHGEQFVFSPTDLTNALGCEFGLLRDLDVKLGRIPAPPRVADAMLARTATLGDEHEARVLAGFVERFGAYDQAAGTGVCVIERPDASLPGAVAAAAARTLQVLRSGADVVYQAAFLRGRFNGYADFIVRTDDGYAVYDSKLARHAKVSALLQLAAYGDELIADGIDVAPQVHLILGDHSVTSHDLHEIIGVYRERRARLEAIVDEHAADGGALAWNDPRFSACGRCDTCATEIQAHRDLFLVAGMRTSQRARLIEADVTTIDELAACRGAVDGVRTGVLASLRAQAALQVRQTRPGDGLDGPVIAEVFNPAGLAVIPPTDPGDIFFDFEGDPLWSDGDPAVTGLEYLFGVIEVDDGAPAFRPFWAHDRAQERRALQEFLDYVVQRRKQYPAMHIYHYASYEKTALLRLAGRYGVGEAIVDDLLRHGVLVDLYSVVRASLRVSQPSYSLKKLEPLYMGDQLRDNDVTNAGESIVAYAEFCQARDAGRAGEAAELLSGIADYNEYDCLSTYRLRDWLLERAADNDITPALTGGDGPADAERDDDVDVDVDDQLVARLLSHAGDAAAGRTPEQHAIALLAAAVGYHRRELKPFWWAHFDRLVNPVEDWADTSDVLVVDEARALSGWELAGKQRNPRRTVRLAGRLGVGSLLAAGATVKALYDADQVPCGIAHEPGRRGVVETVNVVSRAIDAQGRDELVVEECCPSGVPGWSELPMAIVPGRPVDTGPLHRAVVGIARSVADRLDEGASPSQVLGAQPALRILARYSPTTRSSTALPAVRDDDYVGALTEAVRSLDGSYVAVQGPPGSGKTYVGGRVIAALVEAGWRIGVVAQSHKVVENVLDCVIDAGVAADRVGKRAPKSQGGRQADPRWTPLRSDAAIAAFLADHAGHDDDHVGAGCVLGGTAWDFTNRKRVPAGGLDLLVIDEAGQFSLANTIAASTAARNLLLLGDPQQLPQVSQGTHPEPCDISALEWIADGHRVLPAGRGYFLARTWRMHPALTSAVSDLAYDGRLRSNAQVTAARSLDGIEPGVRVVTVEHTGNSVESIEEAEAVVTAAEAVLGRIWTDAHTGQCRPLEPADVLVVAPYNAQVALIRRCLDGAGLADVNVGTVDKFQGQEAPVVIVSMTASAPEEVPRGMDFLLSRNRVNVAVSRGKWCAIVVRSPWLTDYLPANPSGLGRLGAFIRLCQAPVS